MNKSRLVFLRILYIVSDFIMAFLGMMLFDIYRYKHLPEGIENRELFDWLFFDFHIQVGLISIPIIYVLLSALLGYYNDVEHQSRFDDFRSSVINSFICSMIVFFGALINNYLPDHLANYTQLIVLGGVLWLLPYIGRTIITLYQRRYLRRVGGSYRAVIIGPEKSADKLERKLVPSSGKRIPTFKVIAKINPQTCNHLVDQLSELSPDAVILTSDTAGLQNTVQLLTTLYPLNCSIFVSPGIYSLITSRSRFTNVTGEPLINISGANMTPSTVNIKRVFDVVASLGALVVLAPVFAAVALAVKLDSKGPVFYKQQRVGLRKRLFTIYKFRSMYTDAEASGPALSSENDPRITRVGNILRKYRLDEIPQFWNVLIGDMSIVGPRPERPYYVEQIEQREPHYALVHQVRPGLTSWGVVKFGYASTIDQMIERVPYDLLYLENVSIAVDLKIMFHTVNTIITGQGL